MGTNVTNHNHGGDGTGIIVLGIVALGIFGGIIALIMAAFFLLVICTTITGGAIFAYKMYQLRVYQTVSLAAIDAGMLPAPMYGERKWPTPREIMVGRDG